MPASLHADSRLASVLWRTPNVCAAAEALGLSLRGLQRRIQRMRRRGVALPVAGAGKRRWARRWT